MSEIVYEGHIDGWFYGFDDGAIFKTADGTYWRQVNFRYWEYEKFEPKVVIENVDGMLMMTVGGETEQVERLEAVREVEIDGEFVGFNGTKRYTLANGETWEEYGYRYKYRHAFDPEAIIVRVGEATLLNVKGLHARVHRVE